jgi:methyl-accepting chemotaxis protein
MAVPFRSFRTKLQFAFVALGLAAIATTGWQASSVASSALRQAGYDRLTAVRETRASELDRYFGNLRNQVGALVADESVRLAREQFSQAWASIPPAGSAEGLRAFYRASQVPETWFPKDPRVLALQQSLIARNPHPPGVRDLLLDAAGTGEYSRVHARFHPTFHRYKTLFGFYDLFLISAADARVVYTVSKEVDLGVSLADEPYRSTPLARVFRKAMQQTGVVMEDYSPYVPSGMAPAAFLAAPILVAGHPEGVLAVQVAIDEVNGVLDGEKRWRQQGLGETGQAYIVGPDSTLRSDLREGLEDPAAYLRDLAASGISPKVIDRVRRAKTAVLAYPLDLAVIQRIQGGERGTELGRNLKGEQVLRSHAPLNIGELRWAIIAEMKASEALEPVAALRRRIFTTGLGVAFVFFLAATWLGTSVTRPVIKLAQFARRIGAGERGLRIPPPSDDEVGDLARDFNRMSDDLERTTVSKQELEVLAGRLITAEEDERRRVARELHDDFTQRLAAAAITVGQLEKLSLKEAPALQQPLSGLKKEVAALSDEVHALSRRLHPAMLDDLGLEAAIEAECRAVFERSGLIVNVSSDGALAKLPRDVRLALYRITQEGLRNIQRHADTAEAEVRLERWDGRVMLEIRDWGRGFDRADPNWRAGLGLASMEERARLLGGKLSVESRPGEGTCIRVSLPCEQTDE